MPSDLVQQNHSPWNKGRRVGQKRPLKPRDVWTIRVRLQPEAQTRDLAMFNLAIDSKLRGCDLVRLKVDDICFAGKVRERTTVVQKKTGRPVQFELTEQTRSSIEKWLSVLRIGEERFLFPSRICNRPHLSTRQYSRIVHRWIERAGIDSSNYGTHSMRRTKAARSIGRSGTCAQCNSSLVIRNSRAPSGISGLR